jgi:hypothetical protein
MSTPRDLMIVALDMAAGRPVGQGDLSLALAGAEAVDLLRTQTIELVGELMVPRAAPSPPPAPADRLLGDAASALVRRAPYERVEDWLWRRGRGLSAVYLAALEAEGQVVFRRSRWWPLHGGRRVVTESEARRRAAYRWAADEPVLLALAAAVGIRPEPAADEAGVTDEAVLTVLATVHEAVMELEAVRQLRAIEKAAFANVWRGA